MAVALLKRWILNSKPNMGEAVVRPLYKSQCTAIGLVAAVRNQEEFDQLTAFQKQKTEAGFSFDKIVFCPEASIVLDDQVSLKEIRWTGEPKCSKSNAFLAKKYDILYCPNANLPLPVEYLIKRSHARVKAGITTKRSAHYYDLGVETTSHSLVANLDALDELLAKYLNNG